MSTKKISNARFVDKGEVARLLGMAAMKKTIKGDDLNKMLGIICNPFWTGLFPLPEMIDRDDWIERAAGYIENAGAEQFLVNLLDMIEKMIEGRMMVRLPGEYDNILLSSIRMEHVTLRQAITELCLYKEGRPQAWIERAGGDLVGEVSEEEDDGGPEAALADSQ